MDTLESELKELKVFIADLKTDRATQKEKEKREGWTKYTSLSLVCIAVLAAIATQWAGKYSSRTLVELNNSTFNQALATDQWNYYQANSIKLNLLESLHAQTPKELNDGGAEAVKRETAYNEKTKKYTAAKEETLNKAHALEVERDTAKTKATGSSAQGSAMGLAVAIFQISIAMGSICLVVKKKWLWYVSLLLAGFATFKMIAVWI